MIRWFNILLICTALPVFVTGQSLRCIYEDMAIKYYQENDFLKAKALVIAHCLNVQIFSIIVMYGMLGDISCTKCS